MRRNIRWCGVGQARDDGAPSSHDYELHVMPTGVSVLCNCDFVARADDAIAAIGIVTDHAADHQDIGTLLRVVEWVDEVPVTIPTELIVDRSLHRNREPIG